MRFQVSLFAEAQFAARKGRNFCIDTFDLNPVLTWFPQSRYTRGTSTAIVSIVACCTDKRLITNRITVHIFTVSPRQQRNFEYTTRTTKFARLVLEFCLTQVSQLSRIFSFGWLPGNLYLIHNCVLEKECGQKINRVTLSALQRRTYVRLAHLLKAPYTLSP